MLSREISSAAGVMTAGISSHVAIFGCSSIVPAFDSPLKSLCVVVEAVFEASSLAAIN